MFFWYYSQIDRFAVTKNKNMPLIENVFSSNYYSNIEYYRYIPLDDIPINVVNSALKNDPREVCFEITRRCNLTCPVCIARAEPHSDTSLSFLKFQKIIKKLKKNIKRVTITGGEPSLHTEFIDFIQFTSENIDGVVIATNGYQSDFFINSLNNLKGLTITVSLQGSKNVHDCFVGRKGAFDRAINTISKLIEKGHKVEVLTTAFVEAVKSLPELSKQLEAIPINEHRIMRWSGLFGQRTGIYKCKTAPV